ncbi:MAG: M23 family metallopeptidase [bacterium]|nr:M23 family metallopeptidase [bacterium]
MPVLAYARSHNGKLLLMPEVTEAGNSQTMSLLEGYLNINPTGTGGAEIAIIDHIALEAGGGESEVFVDLGKSGTGQISVYVVRQGDTLSEIAEMFGVSANTILWANDIKSSSSIKVGQELVILPISGVRHVVKSGDTLKSIATKYKADLDDILSYNGLAADSKIKLGDVVIIPDGVISVTQTSLAKSSGSGSQSYPSYSGYYLRPLIGGRKSQGIHGHNGVDIATPTGTPILASASGKVIISRSGGYNGGYGTYVVISHSNGTQTLYAHMSKNNVSVGQSIEQGQVIGAVGNTGKSTGSHLHFEVRGAKNPF